MYAERRLKLVEEQIFSLLPEWTLCPVVDALQVMRGIALINSVVLREAGWLRLLACLVVIVLSGIARYHCPSFPALVCPSMVTLKR